MKRIIIAVSVALICLSGLAAAEEAAAAVEVTPVAAPEATPVAEPDLGSESVVKAAQQHLIDLGYLKDKADGVAGPKTAAALKAFQADSGLSETGELDAATLSALDAAAPESVADIQRRLIELGYLRGEADGKWGGQSKQAMKLFQQLHELDATGTPDEASIRKLNSDDVIAMPTRLYQGDKGEEVLRLQRRLYQFGFLTDEPDGSYGKSTVEAVKAFQQRLIDQELAQSFEITASGEATPITQLILYNSAYSTYIGDVAVGDKGAEPLRIERRLYALGYMDEPADDTFDEYAMEALDLFKAQAGVLTFGAADRAAIEALFAAHAPEAVHCAWRAVAKGDTGLTVRAAEEALVYGGMLNRLPEGTYDADMAKAVERLRSYLTAQEREEAALFTDDDSMSKEAVEALIGGLLDYVTDVGGSSKDNEAETARVQRRLYALYYLPKIGVDGKWGGQSRDAVKEFQRDNGLDVTGVADRLTQEVLFSSDALTKRFPYRVEVRLDEQRVHVFQLNDQNEYVEVQNFVCSTGLHDATPHGVFLDAHPLNRWHYFEKFYCWAQYSFQIEGDILFHSVLYGSKGGSVTRSSVNNLGRRASHGCVRLRVEDAKWLYENCKRGTVVVVIY